jgi:hypothetical protein
MNSSCGPAGSAHPIRVKLLPQYASETRGCRMTDRRAQRACGTNRASDPWIVSAMAVPNTDFRNKAV